MGCLQGLVGLDVPLEVVRGFMAVVRCATALLGGRGRSNVAAFDADLGRRVVRQRFLCGGSMDRPAGHGRASRSFLFFRACSPRAPLAEIFGRNVCDAYASSIMMKGRMSYAGGRVTDSGSVLLGVGVHPRRRRRRRRRRHAIVILIKRIDFFRYVGGILDHWARREGLGQ